jgi:hypothetical protein
MEKVKNLTTERGSVQKLFKNLPVTLSINIAISRVILVLALTAGTFVRIWQINAVGFNTDEAVYSGQAAAIAGVPTLKDIFPVFRAHPLLFQFLLSVIYRIQFSDLLGRLLSVLIGIATIYLTYLIGKTLYGRLPGALAAAFLALMPYHVVVTRQALLDGPMVFFATLTIYMLARLGQTKKTVWLYAAGVSMGLTFLSKETSVILMGSIYVFLALAPEIRVRVRDLIASSLLFLLVAAPFPIALIAAGGTSTGHQYLVWQLFRRPNHEWSFYLTTVPPAVGVWLLLAAILGLIWLWRERSWKEKLLIAWILVPVVFFQIWPVKGFQYLLPIVTPLALLAGRALGRLIQKFQNGEIASALSRYAYSTVVPWVLTGLIVFTLGSATWGRVQPSPSALFLAGTGGVPGGREAGTWVLDNVPQNAVFMTIGPSMANIIEFYGERRAYGLSVSPNPLYRNPSYDPIINPDLQIRQSSIQYLVWDSYSAGRSQFFSDKLLGYVNKYNGRVVHTESITTTDAQGNPVKKPVIIIYEVHR